MPEVAEKSQNFEQIIAQEVGNLGLDANGLEGAEASGKVSEVVGENAGENIPAGSGKSDDDDAQDARKGLISSAVSSLLFRSPTTQGYVLPTPIKQKTEVKKAIAKRTRELVNQATRLEKSKNYSAAKMETIVAEIRHLRSIMTQLVNVTVKQLEGLYRKYVWKQ